IKPLDCILAFGIPTDEQSFRSDRNRQDKDFATHFSTWARYKSEFVDHLTTVEPIFRQLGVSVVHQLTLCRYRELVSTSEVFILFSHWSGNSIEFADNLWSVQEVIA